MTIYTNANDAFPHLLRRVMTEGHTIPSRNGATKELTMQQFTLLNPDPAEITVPGRRVSLPAQIAETMWILAGRNDVGWLSHYLPRAAEFSDDGVHWRGGYGPRLRKWAWTPEDPHEPLDQLAHIVHLLKEDPETRRAVLNIYNPVIDSASGKDIPCNNWVHLLARDGSLHAHVAIRSNDLMWGWSGINSFEWTSLLTVVAGLTGLKRGGITFSISSLHLYEQHWAKAQAIMDQTENRILMSQPVDNPAFKWDDDLDTFDDLVVQWFQIEGQIRKGGLSDALLQQVHSFPEPMLRSWLQLLLSWHHDDLSLLNNTGLVGTSLYEALRLSPKRKRPAGIKVKQTGVTVQGNTFVDAMRGRFTVFATKLHAEKNAAYGDSWKKRGEMLGIMANIARKVDRLGVAGGGDTASDTAVDLAVYLIKYNLWLRQQSGAVDAPTEGKSHVSAVDAHLQHLETSAPTHGLLTDDQVIAYIHTYFDRLEHQVEEKRANRGETVLNLIDLAYPLAVRLWGREQHEAWKAGNADRSFDGYNV